MGRKSLAKVRQAASQSGQEGEIVDSRDSLGAVTVARPWKGEAAVRGLAGREGWVTFPREQ